MANEDRKPLMYDDGCAFIVDGQRYEDANAAYRAFRRLYNKSLGKASRRRLGNVGTRKDVISHRGMDFEDEYVKQLKEEFRESPKARCYVLGIIGISYGYMYGEWFYDPAFCEWDDDRRERYIDWLIAAGSTGVRMCGRMDRMVRRKRGKMMTGQYVQHKKKKPQKHKA